MSPLQQYQQNREQNQLFRTFQQATPNNNMVVNLNRLRQRDIVNRPVSLALDMSNWECVYCT